LLFLSFFCLCLGELPPLGWLSFFWLIPFLKLLQQTDSPRGAFAAGYALGILYFGFVLFWIVNVNAGFFVLAVLYQALFLGLFAWGAGVLLKRASWWMLLLSLPAWWTNIEHLRTLGPLSLPAGLLGYQLIPYLPLMQIASVVGIFGVSFLTVFINTLVWLALDPGRSLPRGKMILAGVLLLGALSLWGDGRMKENTYPQSVRLAIVQANIPNAAKWDEALYKQNIARHEELSRAIVNDAPALIVWPETAVPCFIFHPQRAPILQQVQDFIRSVGIPLLTGAQDLRLSPGKKEAYNAAVLFNADASVNGQYAKMRLVPVMEHAPLPGLIPLIRRLGLPCIFTPGREYTVFKLNGWRFSTVICVETQYPATVRRFVKDGAQLLINLTNDGRALGTMDFYYRVNADMLRVRAIENGRSFLRAANTGLSLFVDPYGRLLQEAPRGESAALTGALPLNDRLTFYTRFGDLLVVLGWAWLGVVVVLITGLRSRLEP